MKKICMIAHRGYSAAFQQNTELSFLEAAKNRSGGAETDIRLTKDGVYVTSHDGDLVFEDGSRLTVSDATFEELSAKPLKNTKTDDIIYICTFRRYLEIMRDNNMICFVELKGSFTDEQVCGVFELVKEVYDLKKCILQSFEFDNLIKAHEQFPELPLMLTYGKGESGYERCFDHGFSIDIDHTIVTEELIEQFHSRGLEVGVWTVNDAESLERCRKMGVDYIESDCFGGE